ncbi:NACHT domain-containing protein [Vibrio agarivorans]|uniref:NACHT domain-containing protein n=1 Tax=Vibrio agarivorans TaxID=153622 RepID=UPI0022318C37|nr:NACHT domain-containing protein [Vibrio agarivorans]
MSEVGNITSKALETATGKYIAGKLFGRLDKALSSNAQQKEVQDALATIEPVHPRDQQKIFDMVCDRYLKFRTLLSRDRDVFIDEIYHPLKLKNLSSMVGQTLILNEESVLDLPKITCIIGKAGQGKTTILRKVFVNYLSSSCGKFPLIIALRKVNWDDENLSPPKLITNEFKELGIYVSELVSSYLLQEGRLRILYDGFDEVELNKRNYALRIITETHTTYGANCVVTTRPGTDITYYGGTVSNYELMDLELEDVKSIIDRHTLVPQQDKAQLLDVIENKVDIASILLTPIIVDIFISTYPQLEADPTNVVDVYEQLFQALASTHDKLKISFEREGKSKLTNRQLQNVFQTASFMLLNQKSDVTFSNFELIEAFERASVKHGFETSDTHEDVIDKTSLIKQEGHDYSYLHKSILEFFAAKHIASLNDEARQAYYEFIFINYNSTHENVLRYLGVIDRELFYITFVGQVIESVKGKSGEFYKGPPKVTDDVLKICLKADSFLISTQVGSEDFRIRFDYELTDRLRDILGSVLDVPTNVYHADEILEQAQKQNSKIFKIIEHSKPVRTNIDESEETKLYRVKILEIVDSESEFMQQINKHKYVPLLFDILKKLDFEVEHLKEIYRQKNAISQFY